MFRQQAADMLHIVETGGKDAVDHALGSRVEPQRQFRAQHGREQGLQQGEQQKLQRGKTSQTEQAEEPLLAPETEAVLMEEDAFIVEKAPSEEITREFEEVKNM